MVFGHHAVRNADWGKPIQNNTIIIADQDRERCNHFPNLRSHFELGEGFDYVLLTEESE